MAIRAYVQAHGVRRAVVAGAGLLGLEAAHALHELGLGVVVLDRGPSLLGKQCDPRASALLGAYFERLGIRVLPGTTATEVVGNGRVEGVTLDSGLTVDCGIFLVAAGNKANTELAEAAGIGVQRGVLVNERLETSAPGVFAVGDVAECDGQSLGLWPIAAEQAEIAAVNLLGGDERYRPDPAAAILKGVGIDMTSAGRYNEQDGDEVIVLEGPDIAYRKLVLRDGVLQGGIVLGWDKLSSPLISATKKRPQLWDYRADLYAGNWDCLAKV
jgi:NAD(P)H-nitrite reductase large subunit